MYVFHQLYFNPFIAQRKCVGKKIRGGQVLIYRSNLLEFDQSTNAYCF